MKAKSIDIERLTHNLKKNGEARLSDNEQMKIDIRDKNVVYIEVGDHTYYIDNSTGEQILQVWNTETEETLIDTNFKN